MKCLFYPPHNLSLTYLWIVLGFSFTAYTLYFRLWQDHENQSPLNFTVRTSRHVSSVVTAAAASKGRGSGTGDAGHAGVESAPPPQIFPGIKAKFLSSKFLSPNLHLRFSDLPPVSNAPGPVVGIWGPISTFFPSLGCHSPNNLRSFYEFYVFCMPRTVLKIHF